MLGRRREPPDRGSPWRYAVIAMADTTYLTSSVEPHMIRWVSDKIGVPLSKRKLVVGKTRSEREVSFEIDGVSEDGRTAVFASAAGSIKVGQQRKLFMDAAILLRAPFERRIMVFVDARVWTGFENRCDGLLDLHLIEPMVCDAMPDEMRMKIDAVYSSAKNEVGDLGRPHRLPGKRK